MFFKNIYALVFQTKVASALEGLKLFTHCNMSYYSMQFLILAERRAREIAEEKMKALKMSLLQAETSKEDETDSDQSEMKDDDGQGESAEEESQSEGKGQLDAKQVMKDIEKAVVDSFQKELQEKGENTGEILSMSGQMMTVHVSCVCHLQLLVGGWLSHNKENHCIKITNNIYFCVFCLHLYPKNLGTFLRENLTRMSQNLYWPCRTS